MKKEIAILGSTGSIGKSLLKVISSNKNNFNIVLLSARKNYKDLLTQAKLYNVKNIIITEKKSYQKAKLLLKKKDINIFNNFNNFKKIFNKKIDYAMSSIVGLEGLYPTIKIIKYTKSIAIANKESLICAWNIIKKELRKNKTKFIPVDSEHFSIYFALKNNNDSVKKVYLTASGGPFLNWNYKTLKKIKVKDALNHPNWKMGKKISIDSATMMNKVFEIIEAKNIFNLRYDQIGILIHPSSYIHAIIQFENGLIKMIAHTTDMRIPIMNTLDSEFRKNNKNKINFGMDYKKLNNLSFQHVDIKKYPLVKIIKLLPKKNSLFETILVSANDEYVRKFLNKNINFTEIGKNLLKVANKKEFIKFKKKYPNKIDDIIKLSDYVRLKIKGKSI
tara:strand:+ start:546 stop:1715 length:1170 start_codon:yes stop_codon:yes gene_type:complete